MICPNPILVRRGTPQEMYVPCGKCYYCLQNYRNMWITRLKAENLHATDGLFVTLTYDDQHLPVEAYVDTYTGEVLYKQYPNKKGFQKFLKRLRKNFPFRYFAVPEYGDSTGRVHWHVLFFFDFLVDIHTYDVIDNTWQDGSIIYYGTIEDASIVYVTKYVLKDTSILPFGIRDNIMLCSRVPPIGSHLLMSFKEQAIKNNNFTRVAFGGYQATLPRLFRDKFRKDIEDNHEVDIAKAIELRDKQLKKEFEASSFNDFQKFLVWKLETEAAIRKSNHKKHNKL